MERAEMLQNALSAVKWLGKYAGTDSFTAFCALFMACVIVIGIIYEDHEHHQMCLKRQEASRLEATIKECMNRYDDDTLKRLKLQEKSAAERWKLLPQETQASEADLVRLACEILNVERAEAQQTILLRSNHCHDAKL